MKIKLLLAMCISHFVFSSEKISLNDNTSKIPKIVFQTSKKKIEPYVVDTIKYFCPEWKYEHFTDDECIDFFNNNPLDEFPNIINKFNSFSRGAHKADLFRYYYLWINGGVFLDSDAMFEKEIDKIIESYDAVFISPKHVKNCIFNGFIATVPKNPIIYQALRHAYNTDNATLQKEYLYFCYELFKIIKELDFPNIHIFSQMPYNREKSIVINSKKELLLTHYFLNKTIPKDPMTEEFERIYKTNAWKCGSGPGSSIINTKVYNQIVIDFIKNNNIKTVVDLGCGDWQSSYLIYENVNVEYLGIDCVKNVINENRKKFPNYKFESMNIIKNIDQMPSADLYILKDVLQHWKLNDIYTFLDKLVQKEYKYILISNNGNQNVDNLELQKVQSGRGLHSNFFPLKKYNVYKSMDYFHDEKKHLCFISKKLPCNDFQQIDEKSKSSNILKNMTQWNHYNKDELDTFPYTILNTYDIPNPKIRLGPKSDGGYVIVDGLKYDLFLSSGIGCDIRFENAFLAKYQNVNCIAFDGTIKDFPRHNNNIRWIKKNVGFVNNQNKTNLKEYLLGKSNIFLKMDIEGAEFNWLDSMSLDDLNKFSQIVMEVHWPFDEYRWKTLNKLNKTHYLVHIHGNNYSNGFAKRDIGRTYDGCVIINNSSLEQIRLPEVFEVTFVRKSLFDKDKVKQNNINFPTELDFPNNPKDKDISFAIPY